MKPVLKLNFGEKKEPIEVNSKIDKVEKAQRQITMAKEKAKDEIEAAKKSFKAIQAELNDTVLFQEWSGTMLDALVESYIFSLEKLLLEGYVPDDFPEALVKEERLKFFKKIIEKYELEG